MTAGPLVAALPAKMSIPRVKFPGISTVFEIIVNDTIEEEEE